MACGQRLAALLSPGDVVALDGELGAGKTQFTRGLAEGLGLDPGHVSSPTFVMMHEYEPEPDVDAEGHQSETQGGHVPLFHLDAYRIGGPDDLASLGFDAELRATGVSVVEWAQRIASMLGSDVIHITLAHGPNDTRSMALTPRGRWTKRVNELQQALTGQTG